MRKKIVEFLCEKEKDVGKRYLEIFTRMRFVVVSQGKNKDVRQQLKTDIQDFDEEIERKKAE
jgi:hypothetical protein